MTASALGYCLNVFPGERLQDAVHAIEQAATLRTTVPNYHLGLRLGATAVAELADPATADAFEQKIIKTGVPVLGINGFPYGTFHQVAVKDAVYQPDWLTPERADYTLALLTFLSRFPRLPGGIELSVTTVPLAYRATGHRVGDFYPTLCAFAQRLLDTYAAHPAAQSRPMVAFEPEPDCLIDSLESILDFFDGLYRYPDFKSEYHDLFGLCLDTCHSAIMGDELLIVIEQCQAHNIPISRIQVSAALATTPATTADELKPFVDSVYLHQTRTATQQFPDLTDDVRFSLHAAARIHYHVPLAWPGTSHLRTTRDALMPAFWHAVTTANYPLEIETYTYSQLSTIIPQGTILQMMQADLHWLKQTLSSTL